MRGFGRVYKRKGSRFWWISLSVRGRVIRESSRSLKKDDAKELLRRRLEEYRLVPGVVSRARVSEILDDQLAEWERQEIRSMLVAKRAAKLIGEFCGHDIARDVDSSRASELQAHLQELGYAQATVNQILGLFKTALRGAARRGKIGPVPIFPRRLREALPRQGFLEHSTYLAILEELPAWAGPVFSFAYASGWRKMEILTLKWSEVDLEGGVIRLDRARSKTREGRVLPIVGEVQRVIEGQSRARALGSPWVFHRDGKRIGRSAFRRVFVEACEIAGYPGVIFHDTRRTAVRNLVRAGVPEQVAMKLSGHKSRSVFERYDIVSEDELTGAAEQLGRYLEKKEDEAKRRVLPFQKRSAETT